MTSKAWNIFWLGNAAFCLLLRRCKREGKAELENIKWRKRPVWPDWAIFWTLGNFSKPLATINLPKSPTFLGNFCKGVKIYHFWATFIDIWRFFSGHTGKDPNMPFKLSRLNRLWMKREWRWCTAQLSTYTIQHFNRAAPGSYFVKRCRANLEPISLTVFQSMLSQSFSIQSCADPGMGFLYISDFHPVTQIVPWHHNQGNENQFSKLFTNL